MSLRIFVFRTSLTNLYCPLLSYAGPTQKNGHGMNFSVKKRKCFPVFFRTNASPLGCTRALFRCSTGAPLPCMRLHIASGGVGPPPMAALHRSMTAQQVRTHERSHVLHTPPHSRKPSRAPTCNEQQLATRRTRRADGGRDRRCARRRSSIFLADAIRHSSDTVLQ